MKTTSRRIYFLAGVPVLLTTFLVACDGGGGGASCATTSKSIGRVFTMMSLFLSGEGVSSAQSTCAAKTGQSFTWAPSLSYGPTSPSSGTTLNVNVSGAANVSRPGTACAVVSKVTTSQNSIVGTPTCRFNSGGTYSASMSGGGDYSNFKIIAN